LVKKGELEMPLFKKKLPLLKSDNAGIFIEGCDSNGYIKNTNDFPVRIREVSTNVYFGEETRWVRVF